jgi:hypothetical protein
MHPLCDPDNSSSATSSTIDVDQPLAIRNPEMLLALFVEPNFLRLPWAAIPYELYPGLPPLDFDYCLQMPTSDIVEEPGVIPGDDWLHNIEGLSSLYPYTIPGLGGRMVEAPFYRYDFTPDYPELLLSQG